jgi:uncharacterized protein YyaL (SSP411 family)
MPPGGGFFFSRRDHEDLVLRPKSGHDRALASGNAVAALQLQRLGYLVGGPRHVKAARRRMAVFATANFRVLLSFARLDLRAPHRRPAGTGGVNQTVRCGRRLVRPARQALPARRDVAATAR